MPRILFVIENVSYRTDSRVRRESGTLRAAGSQVVVISPADPGEPFHAVEDGVHVYRYRKPAAGEGVAAHLAEYAVSVVSHTLLAALVYGRHGFDVIHAANPPDLCWIVALPYKMMGRKYIFDHHDLVPELFEVRYAHTRAARFATRLVYAAERANLRLADHVVSTNDTFRRVAMERGGRAAEDVTVVRNGPRRIDFPDLPPEPSVRALGRIVVGYLGNMNPQDGLELFLEMAREVRAVRADVGFVMIGTGDSWSALRARRDAMGLGDAVRMTGSLPWAEVVATLSAVDLCVQPDPPTRFNSKLTHNKLMEYMALGKPAIAFDMPETRVSGGDAVVYVPGDSPRALADAVIALAEDPGRREAMAAAGLERVERVLGWHVQESRLLSVYQRLFGEG